MLLTYPNGIALLHVLVCFILFPLRHVYKMPCTPLQNVSLTPLPLFSLSHFHTFYFRHRFFFTVQMNICSFLILLSLTIASPLLPVDSALLPDFTNFQLDPLSNDETVVSSTSDPGLVGQTQSPLPGISTSQDTGPPIIDSWLDAVQVQPSFPSSNSDMAGSRFELAQNSPTAEKVAPAGERTVDAVYLCCESKGEDKFLCDDSQRW